METHSNFPPIPAASNGKSYSIPESFTPMPESEETENWSSQQLFSLLRRRILLIFGVAVVVTSAIAVTTLNQKPSYKSGFQLLVEPVTADNVDQLAQNSGNQIIQNTNLDYPTQIQVLLSPKLMKPIIKKIQERYPDVTYETIGESLTVERPLDTKILVVSYQDMEPQRVKFVLDQLAQGYLRYSQQERQSNLRQGIKFINDQIAQTQDRVNLLQRRLQVFRQQNNFVDPEAQVTQVAGQLSGLEQKRLDTEKELAELQKSYNNLQGRSGALAALASDAAYQSFLTQLRDLDSKIAIESARFQDDNPALDALRSQRDNLLPILRQEARRVLGNKLADSDNQISILETRQQAIADAERQLNQKGERLPVVARLYTDMQRELNVATESLQRFLETRENLQVGAAQKEVPWQLIAAPELPKDADSTLARNLVLGAIAGLMTGIAAALITDKLDTTIRLTADLKRHTKLPLLGTIPYNTKQTGAIPTILPRLLQVDRLRRSFQQPTSRSYTDQIFSEAFRSLYTSLRLLSADTRICSIVISSALPGEGKSTVSMNLAQAAAAMGQRVLLVDADLRNPQISNLLDLPNEMGLSDLIETNLHPEQVIRPVYQVSSALASSEAKAGSSRPSDSETTNLYAVASGQSHFDPTRLLSSQKMQQLVAYFQSVFDLVIYDTPPLLTLADSSLLAAYTDGMILVAGLGKVDRSALSETLESLKTMRISVWGVVANSSEG